MKGTRGPKMDPSNADQTLTVGFLNILGQTKLKQPKQNQIQFIMQEHKIDILHLQETNILEDTFKNCNLISSSYNIISNNSPTNYGTSCLIKSDLEAENHAFISLLITKLSLTTTL